MLNEQLNLEYRGNNEWRVGPWTVTWREHNRIGHAPEWWVMHMGRPHHIADRGCDAVKWARENADLLQ